MIIFQMIWLKQSLILIIINKNGDNEKALESLLLVNVDEKDLWGHKKIAYNICNDRRCDR